jgi:4'-phosphopantetheinyl transferase
MTDWPVMSPDRTVPPAQTLRCWRVIVDSIDDRARQELHAILDEDETARASRFVKASDRRSFTAAHAGLRLVLAAALGRDARGFRFTRGDVGKPGLPDCAVEFNLSHSGGIVLIAIASSIEIGADVELIRPMKDRPAITREFLHPGEAADLAALSEAEAELAFFRCWTRKEAVSKALGLGLSLPLNEFRVSCRPGAPAELLHLPPDETPSESWSLIDLPDPGPSHVGAVAARHRPLVLSCRTLDLAKTLAES